MRPASRLLMEAPIETAVAFLNPCLIDLASARPSIWAEALMNFTLIRAEYDRETQRAYVELRARDDDGGDSITVAISLTEQPHASRNRGAAQTRGERMATKKN